MASLDKAPDAFRTISEVAGDLDVPQHVLRFWESRFAQIKPMKRGGGRRYYRPEDVDLLRGIRFLLYGEGYTIRGVQRILREQGIRFVQLVWQEGGPKVPPGAGDVEPGDEEEESNDRVAGFLENFPSEDGDDEDGDDDEAEDESDDDDDDNAGNERIEPTLHPPALRLASDPAPRRASDPAASTLSRAQKQQLETALRDLRECRRLLDRALDDDA